MYENCVRLKFSLYIRILLAKRNRNIGFISAQSRLWNPPNYYRLLIECGERPIELSYWGHPKSGGNLANLLIRQITQIDRLESVNIDQLITTPTERAKRQLASQTKNGGKIQNPIFRP